MPSAQFQVGPQNNADSSALVTGRAGKQGEALASDLHGRYYEQNYRGNIFFVANQSVATTSVGLSTTYTGLCLSNPIGSGVNLVLLQATMNQSVIQSTQVEGYGIAVGSNSATNVTHTAAITPQSGLVGSGYSPKGKADSSATLPTAPVYAMFVQNTATATVNGPAGVVEIAGSLILTPGAYACWVTPAQASVAGLWFSFSWEEVPV